PVARTAVLRVRWRIIFPNSIRALRFPGGFLHDPPGGELGLQLADAVEDAGEALAEGGERILDARRHLGVGPAREHPEARELAQALVQHLLRQARHRMLYGPRAADARAHLL